MHRIPLIKFADINGINRRTAHRARERADVGKKMAGAWWISSDDIEAMRPHIHGGPGRPKKKPRITGADS